MLAALSAVLLALPAAAAPTRIGSAAAVSGVVKASAAGAVGRVIGSGKPLFLNDRVTTDANGRLQIMLLDETVFTLGPNADMVLDEFVYDPDTGAGKVAANITKGAFRFVTGKIARNRPEDMNVKLKVGTIGIRGTVVVGETGDEGSTIINAGAAADNNAGEPASNVLAENGGQSTLIAKPGDGVTIKPNEPPSSPTDMTGRLDQLSGQLGANSTPSNNQQASKGGSSESSESEGGASGESASQTAGQTTAQGQDIAEEETVVGDASSEASALVVVANQTTGLADGIAQWADLARLQGMGYYSNGSGTYTCGGTCSGGGDFTFSFDVNFDAKQVSAGSFSFGSGSISDSASVGSPIDFAALTGSATFSPFASSFSGTTASFLNANGQAGSSIQLQLNYDNGNDQATGTGTATFSDEAPNNF